MTALFALLLLAGRPAEETYAPAARVTYLEEALAAVKATSPKALEQAERHVAALAGSTCASEFRRLTVECLVSAASRYCKNRPAHEATTCPLVLDLVVTNYLAQEEFISQDRRYELMRAKDYRHQMDLEVRESQGALAADFALRTQNDALAIPGRIDRYCLEGAQSSELSWQSCAGALVWFIGTNSPNSSGKEH